MKKEKYSWIEVMTKFDKFEADFAKDSNNPELVKFFENFGVNVVNSDFDAKQLAQIRDKMNHLRELFMTRKNELKAMSSEALTKHTQLKRYIKNANYKSVAK